MEASVPQVSRRGCRPVALNHLDARKALQAAAPPPPLQHRTAPLARMPSGASAPHLGRSGERQSLTGSDAVPDKPEHQSKDANRLVFVFRVYGEWLRGVLLRRNPPTHPGCRGVAAMSAPVHTRIRRECAQRLAPASDRSRRTPGPSERAGAGVRAVLLPHQAAFRVHRGQYLGAHRRRVSRAALASQAPVEGWAAACARPGKARSIEIVPRRLCGAAGSSLPAWPCPCSCSASAPS